MHPSIIKFHPRSLKRLAGTFNCNSIFDVLNSIIRIFKIILNFKQVTTNLIKDNTEEISNMVRNILNNKSYLYRRLVNAFPDFKTLTKKIKDKIND